MDYNRWWISLKIENMITIQGHTEDIYYVAHNGTTAYAYGKLEVGMVLTSGQPYVEQFTDEVLWLQRCSEFGVDPYYEEPIPEPPSVEITPTLTDKQRLSLLEDTTEEIIVNLNEKGIL